ncbi:MAG: hypothetical protein J0I77_01875 [Rudaea sp.]|uniref:DUF6988 family protein n=1 Tax=unclassified Rudaea TaxID=2627037 RepID=UPI0010FA49A2|nr:MULTISPECIES: hypothetical protein [unclassified Rudaea]MBN8884443.1 hypothetical protein [Rudaea sp.]
MPDLNLYERSATLAQELFALTQHLELANDSPRLTASAVAVSLAHEHWDGLRPLLASGMLPSAVVVHRAQFEATVRSIWLTYAATDGDVAKLSADLNVETEQSAKNIPSVFAMMASLPGKAPPQAIEALGRFKDNSWRALTSYAHAGIHAISRHRDGYPAGLSENLLRNANGLGVVGYFQLVGICGRQPLQHDILGITARFTECLPDPIK